MERHIKLHRVHRLNPIVDTEGIRYGPIKVKDQDIKKIFREAIKNVDKSENV